MFSQVLLPSRSPFRKETDICFFCLLSLSQTFSLFVLQPEWASCFLRDGGSLGKAHTDQGPSSWHHPITHCQPNSPLCYCPGLPGWLLQGAGPPPLLPCAPVEEGSLFYHTQGCGAVLPLQNMISTQSVGSLRDRAPFPHCLQATDLHSHCLMGVYTLGRHPYPFLLLLKLYQW